MRNTHCRNWIMSRNTEKKWKMRHKHCMTWNIARNTEKGGKMRNILGRTWNMARVLKIMENEKHTLYDVKYGKKKH